MSETPAVHEADDDALHTSPRISELLEKVLQGIESLRVGQQELLGSAGLLRGCRSAMKRATVEVAVKSGEDSASTQEFRSYGEERAAAEAASPGRGNSSEWGGSQMEPILRKESTAGFAKTSVLEMSTGKSNMSASDIGLSSGFSTKGASVHNKNGLHWAARVAVHPDLARAMEAGPVQAWSHPRRRSSRGLERLNMIGPISTFGAVASEGFDPARGQMLFFELVGIAVMMHDLVVTSYVTALDVEVEGLAFALGMASLLYWILHFIMQWFLGFYLRGELIVSIRMIRRHYLRGWCVADAAMILIDLVSTTLSLSKHTQAGEVLRIAKFLRTFRVLRITKLKGTMDMILQLNVSRRIRDYIRCGYIVIGVLLYNHLVSCVWCAVGFFAPSDSGARWLDFSVTKTGGPGSELTFHDVAKHRVYLAALHWTVAQMTPGPIDVVATNHSERTFSVAFLITGLLFNSLIVSLFSGQIVQRIMRQRAMMESLDVVQNFLLYHNVQSFLSRRIQRQVRDKLTNESAAKVCDMPALQFLSEAMRLELFKELFLPHLVTHSLFRLWSESDPHDVECLTAEAVDQVFVIEMEEVFKPKNLSKGAYIIVNGSFTYKHRFDHSPHRCRAFDDSHQEGMIADLDAGTWVSEVSLWTIWRHRGFLQATEASYLLSIHAESLYTVLAKSSPMTSIVYQYGLNYHKKVTQSVPPYGEPPSDLGWPSHQTAFLLGFHAGLLLLEETYERDANISAKQVLELKEEICAETCHIHRKNGGELERVVRITVAKLMDQPGGCEVERDFSFQSDEPRRFLAEVGKLDMQSVSSLKAEVRLPAKKLEGSEDSQQGLEGILSRLADLLDQPELDSIERVDEVAWSKRYGMSTIYHKSVYSMLCARTPSKDFLEPDGQLSGDCPVPSRPIYVVSEGPKARLLMWVTDEEIKLLTTDGGAELWKSWLSRLVASATCGIDTIVWSC